MHPNYISVYRVTEELHRHYPTIREWCAELGIVPRKIGARGHYITIADMARLRARNESRPCGLQYREVGAIDDHDPQRRIARDHELARRIEAASRWKRRHNGAPIRTADLDHELAAMSAFPTI